MDALTGGLIHSIIDEHFQAERLSEFGLKPSRKILLTGPPGVGKTMTAQHLTSRLNVPMLTVDLGTIMSSYLGRSAQNLQEALAESRAQSSALFIDEFDAVAKRRDDGQDVGELKRLVNVLLLELDNPEGGIIIAATNHPELLDRAIARRFDRLIAMPLPDPGVRARLVALHPSLISANLTDGDMQAIALATAGMSHSEIRTEIDRQARHAVLSGGSWDEIGSRLLQWAVERLVSIASNDQVAREALARTAVHSLGMSRRQAAQLLGVTHPTVSKMLKGSTAAT